MSLLISKMNDLAPGQLDGLIAESERHGFAFVRRLAEEWLDGANRFDRPGELLLKASLQEQIVGVCGLNLDPFLRQAKVGRVRHLYVLASHRRKRIGRRLIEQIVAESRPSFDRLRLRTTNPDAALFYESLGFTRCADDETCTHLRDLSR
jgi:GNAT superfamily N-acetyltransferase